MFPVELLSGSLGATGKLLSKAFVFTLEILTAGWGVGLSVEQTDDTGDATVLVFLI